MFSARAVAMVVAVASAIGLALAPGAAARRVDAEVPPVKLTQLQDFAVSAMATRPNDPTIYVTQVDGWVDAITIGKKFASRVLDLRSQTAFGVEGGLLGLVFSADGSKLYVAYTSRKHTSRVEEYAFANGVADPKSRRRLLDVPRATTREHNGGQLAFGPDGMLYTSLGDGGGGAADHGPGHAPGGNGQSLDTLLGKILRIDPTPSADAPYTIPRDNPFANGGGRPEIWAYGLRNPWRFSFDAETGDLWIGDVGEDRWDEIDLAPSDAGRGRGVNYGWNVFEGPRRLRNGTPTGGTAQAPLLGIPHHGACNALIGGFVYRGSKIPALRGAYLYGDFCNKQIRWLREVDGKVVARGVLGGVHVKGLASFGEDRNGELYVLSLADGLFRIDPA